MRKPKIQFSLYRLLIVVAVYALAVGLCSQFGGEGIVIGVVLGSSLSGIILLARRRDLPRILIVEYGSLLGAFVCFLFIPVPAEQGNGFALRLAPFAGYGWLAFSLALGAFVGGFITSLLRKHLT